ncbi:ubiquinol oxidase subunit II [Paraglaciecola chathamensis]|uniref:Ubiquinol oxidase subunit 2 n=2 Tax=Paraglaciecola chathamensis TaxID=368405 RepID=A0ABQ0I9Z4_9ALTE|nr:MULTISPECIES: ubiquinol oxidase subunit II [Paraglaciecola]GAC06131.1 cytochrome o ubiquinol oxidase subunit II [Paraglaciecola agarilytica NO2]GAC10698.1 cytochrome o ubiquinol oxidase subunit II [Paraglaciecola chathamensis S18K6]
MLIRKLGYSALTASILLLSGCEGGVLDPKGQVGIDEKYLIVVATVLMLLVVIPVIGMTLYFAWRYREGREHEIYDPKWAHSTKIEVVVWLIPIVIIAILGTLTWYSTQELDPYKPLDHEHEPITIQVVSLNWKWLFIYPEQGIATVNEVVFPKDVPVEFKITSDTTMNSFFIPQLGSQIYSMAGMTTRLNLIANEAGEFDGISANYSGAGFTGMKFKAIAKDSEQDFEKWVSAVKHSPATLNDDSYAQLAKHSENNPVSYYGSVDSQMFQHVVMQFMGNMKQQDMHGEHQEHSAQMHMQAED